MTHLCELFTERGHLLHHLGQMTNCNLWKMHEELHKFISDVNLYVNEAKKNQGKNQCRTFPSGCFLLAAISLTILGICLFEKEFEVEV